MVWRDLTQHEVTDIDAVLAVHTEALAFARENDLRVLGGALVTVSETALEHGRLEQGRALSEEALHGSDGSQSLVGTLALINLAHVANVESRFRTGMDLSRRAVLAALERGDHVTSAWAASPGDTAWPWTWPSASPSAIPAPCRSRNRV